MNHLNITYEYKDKKNIMKCHHIKDDMMIYLLIVHLL